VRCSIGQFYLQIFSITPFNFGIKQLQNDLENKNNGWRCHKGPATTKFG
jgi:hypothetical protein